MDSLFKAAEGGESWEDRLEELARQVALCRALSNVMSNSRSATASRAWEVRQISLAT